MHKFKKYQVYNILGQGGPVPNVQTLAGHAVGTIHFDTAPGCTAHKTKLGIHSHIGVFIFGNNVVSAATSMS